MTKMRIQLETIFSLVDPKKTYLLGYYEKDGRRIASFLEQIGSLPKWHAIPVPDEFRQTLTALEDRILERGYTLCEPSVVSPR